MRPGPRNLITDVEGLKVGCAEDAALRSGATVVTAEAPFVAAVHVMGGAPGTRETDLLAPDKLVTRADALVLSGGSVFGLDAASGVADGLRAMGRGFVVGPVRAPIVPGAILFDLLNGGDKDWTENPYRALGRAALERAGEDFALGSAGAGFGALTADFKGGLGSASCLLESGITVGALAAVNSLGSVVVGEGPEFWAAPWEMSGEFGGLPAARRFDPGFEPSPTKRQGESTTICVVATDAVLTQAEALRMATAAHDGLARSISPSHTPFDGDLIFAAAMGARALKEPDRDRFVLGHAAAVCLSRAVARAVYEARSLAGDLQPSWRSRFGAQK